MTEASICDAVRTPFGRYYGCANQAGEDNRIQPISMA